MVRSLHTLSGALGGPQYAYRRPPARDRQSLPAALVFDLEAIREGEIPNRQRSTMLGAGHHLAREEVAYSDIGDERLVEDVLRRRIELTAQAVALEAACGRREQAAARARIDTIPHRAEVERASLQQNRSCRAGSVAGSPAAA